MFVLIKTALELREGHLLGCVLCEELFVEEVGCFLDQALEVASGLGEV